MVKEFKTITNYQLVRNQANLLFPEHTKITEKEFSDYYNAFLCMDSKFIRENLSVISESIWVFDFNYTFFCIVHNPGLKGEVLYFGIAQ